MNVIVFEHSLSLACLKPFFLMSGVQIPPILFFFHHFRRSKTFSFFFLFFWLYLSDNSIHNNWEYFYLTHICLSISIKNTTKTVFCATAVLDSLLTAKLFYQMRFSFELYTIHSNPITLWDKSLIPFFLLYSSCYKWRADASSRLWILPLLFCSF